jgi:hypothetical protein
MLDRTLKFLTDELNTYLKTQSGDFDSADKVKMSKLVDDSGKYAFQEGTIAASIINIEEDRIFKAQTPEHVYSNGQQVVLEPEIKLNLHVIFAANFGLDNYGEALKYISYILTYFQSHPFFTSVAYPALDPQIAKLTTELQSLSYEQLNQIWAFIGGKQLPSVIYKIRMVSMQSIAPTQAQPPIQEINTNLYVQ